MRQQSLVIGLLCIVLGATAGCDKSKTPDSQLDKNIEKSIGPVQSNTGMLGGNDAPIGTPHDGGADAQGDRIKS